MGKIAAQLASKWPCKPQPLPCWRHLGCSLAPCTYIYIYIYILLPSGCMYYIYIYTYIYIYISLFFARSFGYIRVSQNAVVLIGSTLRHLNKFCLAGFMNAEFHVVWVHMASILDPSKIFFKKLVWRSGKTTLSFDFLPFFLKIVAARQKSFRALHCRAGVRFYVCLRLIN